MKKNGATGKNLALIKRFFPYLRKHLGTEAVVLLCAMTSAACEIALPLIVRTITDTDANDPQKLTVSLVLSIAAAYIALRGLDSFASYCQSYWGHKMGTKIENSMREDMFDHLQKLSFTFFDNTKVGQLMSRMTSDLFDVAEWAHHFPEMVLMTVVKFVASFFIFATMDIRFAVAIFILMPLMILFTKKSRTKMRDTFKEGRHQVGEINARIEDSLLGVRVVRSFTNEKIEKEKFSKGNEAYVHIRNKSHKYMSQFHATVKLIDGITYISVIALGALLMKDGIMSPGDFAASLLLISTLLGSIRTIVDFSEQFSRGVTGVERFVEIMNEEPEIIDSDNAVDIENVQGEIEFRDVSFSYVKGEKQILNNLNLKIRKGGNVALVGPSGGGKTTLCNLIPRFYEAESGEILLDGKNIKDITLRSLRSNIGVVAQDVYLFSGTIRDNLVYGKADATDEELIEATKKAGAHEFISALPDGYDTYIGERGVKLSGGQKQRISIARVFLKNPPVLLLDEATSALDNESEKLVQESLERLAKGRTTLTIAHRLTTIRNADEIVVLTEDGIAEQGSHTELMQKGGIYSNMYSMYATM
ncbi:MAG: ABC transporter ATP-binding protein [Acutalibacteraceae bacterium]|nr:ABC transporter ATP-binding protein [Acutalibacteraceae bacterium]